VVEDLMTTSAIPIINPNRTLSFDKDTIEKLEYLKEIKKEGDISDICNKALEEFLKIKFKELHLNHFIDTNFEAGKIALQKRLEEDAKKRDDFRILQLAKTRIMENAIKDIRADETKTGIKTEFPRDIRTNTNYKKAIHKNVIFNNETDSVTKEANPKFNIQIDTYQREDLAPYSKKLFYEKGIPVDYNKIIKIALDQYLKNHIKDQELKQIEQIKKE